jgi:hypothetical protein
LLDLFILMIHLNRRKKSVNDCSCGYQHIVHYHHAIKRHRFIRGQSCIKHVMLSPGVKKKSLIPHDLSTNDRSPFIPVERPEFPVSPLLRKIAAIQITSSVMHLQLWSITFIFALSPCYIISGGQFRTCIFIVNLNTGFFCVYLHWMSSYIV